VQEEAGVDADVVRELGRLDYDRPRGPVRADIFLMRFVGDVSPAEDRETRWCTLDEAMRLVDHEDTRALIRKAFG
jgi:8-oxo-dGTP pyrophosphatase MutT (NUDIX family)